MVGLMIVIGDVFISVDVDLQDDLEVILKMLDKYVVGCDIVYGVCSLCDKDIFFKCFIVEGYYILLKRLGIEVVFNYVDYWLMSW